MVKKQMQERTKCEMNQIYLNDFKKLLGLMYADYLKRQRRGYKNGNI